MRHDDRDQNAEYARRKNLESYEIEQKERENREMVNQLIKVKSQKGNTIFISASHIMAVWQGNENEYGVIYGCSEENYVIVDKESFDKIISVCGLASHLTRRKEG